MANTIDTMTPEVILRKIIDGSITELEDDTVTSVAAYKFAYNTNITSLKLPNCTSFNMAACYGASKLETLYLPKASSISFNNTASVINGTKISILVLPKISGAINGAFFQGNTKLTKVDLGPAMNKLGGNLFSQANNLKTLILRRTSIVTAANSISANIFGGSGTNGMRGGTIYIPKVLYDHLGDGTSLDYKSATNWTGISSLSTTWAQIEGSEYEHYYADGTPIPTE